MTITTLSSREFDQSVSEAKRAANDGPVFITNRGRTTHVLMSIELYEQLTGSRKKIADLLAIPGIENVDLEIPSLRELARPVDFV